MTKLSFIIPAHNEEHYIAKCLDSIFKEIDRLNLSAQVIVVDNASADKTAQEVRKFPRAILVQESRQGTGWARQAGFLQAKGEFVANLDADVILPQGWIEKCFKEFKQNPNLVALGGPYIYYDLPRFTKAFIKAFYYLAYLSYLIQAKVMRRSSVIILGNVMIRRQALEQVGGYNTKIVFYGDDTDLALRLQKIGRVKFTFKIPVYSSGRRLAHQGLFTMAWHYSLNYFWVIYFKKPFSLKYVDVRPKNSHGILEIKPQNKTKEFIIAFLTLAFFIGVMVLAIWGIIVLVRYFRS